MQKKKKDKIYRYTFLLFFIVFIVEIGVIYFTNIKINQIKAKNLDKCNKSIPIVSANKSISNTPYKQDKHGNKERYKTFNISNDILESNNSKKEQEENRLLQPVPNRP